MTDRTTNPTNIERLARSLHAKVGLTHYSGVEFLIALVVLLVVTPFVEGLRQAVLIEGLLLTVVLCSAVLAVGGNRKTLIIAMCLSVPTILAKWMNHFIPEIVSGEVFPVAAIVFVGFVIISLLRFILNSRQVSTDVLCAGIAVYLTLGLLWTFAYLLVSRATPGAFSFPSGTETHVLTPFDTLYFSYVTLSTVGFGDISPVSPAARMLAVLEALTGTIYLAVLVSRLVSMNLNELQQIKTTLPPT